MAACSWLPTRPLPASLFTLALLAFPAIGFAADAQAASGLACGSPPPRPRPRAAPSPLKVQNRTGARLAGKISAKAGEAARRQRRLRGQGAAATAKVAAAAVRRRASESSPPTEACGCSVTATVKGRGSRRLRSTLTAQAPRGTAPGHRSRTRAARPAARQREPEPGRPHRWRRARTTTSRSPSRAARSTDQAAAGVLQCSENGGAYRSYGSCEPFSGPPVRGHSAPRARSSRTVPRWSTSWPAPARARSAPVCAALSATASAASCT